LKEKKAIAISNYEEKATIIVCSQRFFNPDNSNSFQIYEKLGINITNKLFEVFFSGLLSFWKDKFEE